MNKKGVTLVELLIYTVLFSVISLLIGTQMKSMTKSFSGGKALSVLQSDSRDALAVMTRDICNTGLKQTWIGTTLSSVPGTFLSDSSSFSFSKGTPGDWLKIFKANESGISQEIEYYLDGTSLIRKFENKSTSIAENVYALQFQYGVYNINTILVASSGLASGTWTKHTTYLYFNQGFNINGESCLRINHRINFNSGLENKIDSLRWEIKSSSGIIGSEAFKCDTSNGILIPVAPNGNVFAYLYLRYFLKSGETSSLDELQSCTLWLDNVGKYNWTNEPETSKKKYVKAIKVEALMRSKNKSETSVNSDITIGNITVNRDGPYSWRNYSEIIEIPNNGLF